MTGARSTLDAAAGKPLAGGRADWHADVRVRIFGIDSANISPPGDGFASASPERQARLQRIGRVFALGYNSAIRLADPNLIAADLDAIEREDVGFAFEGAGMGFALLDALTPWPARRLAEFLATDRGKAHSYMIHVGAGWALARTAPWLAWRLGPLDPLLRWLMYDGLGFHHGYFHPRAAIHRHRVPLALRGEARAVFDQGLGRSLWFACGAQAGMIRATIASFPAARHADLWSGVGLAAAYAGGMPRDEQLELRAASGLHARWLGQGAAFAAEARLRADNPAPHTDLACCTLCGCDAPAAAAITRETRPSPARADNGTAYCNWRQAIAAGLPEAET